MDEETDLMTIPQMLLAAVVVMVGLPVAALVAAAIGVFQGRRAECEVPRNCTGCGRSLGVGAMSLARMTENFECPSCRLVIRATRGA